MKYKDFQIGICRDCGKISVMDGYYTRYCKHCAHYYTIQDKVNKNGFLEVSKLYIEQPDEPIIDLSNFEMVFKEDLKSIDIINILKKMRKERNKEELEKYLNEKVGKTEIVHNTYVFSFNRLEDKFLLTKNDIPVKRAKSKLRDLMSSFDCYYHDFSDKESIFSMFDKKIQILLYHIGISGKYRNYNKLMTILKYPFVEILIKAGIVFNFFKGYGINGISPIMSINENGTKPKDILNISKRAVKEMQKCTEENIKGDNINQCSIHAVMDEFQKLQRIGLQDIDNFEYMMKTIDEKRDEIRNMFNTYCYMSPNDEKYYSLFKLINDYNLDIDKVLEYLTDTVVHEQGRINISDNIQMYLDLFRINEELEVDKFEHYPRSLIVAHDKAAYIKLLKQEEINEKNFKKRVEENSKLEYKDSKYTLLTPKSPSELIAEGAALSHCVGTYVNRYINGMSKIFFMRESDNIDTPLVTIELNSENSLMQARGKFNREITAEERAFILKWLSNIKNKIYKEAI